MTVTYLTLNPKVGSISEIAFPTDLPDPKSKLRFKWNLWVQMDIDMKQQELVDYKASTKTIACFDSIQSFWEVFDAVPQPSVFLQGTNVTLQDCDQSVNSLMIFREGVSPEWEDPINADGGHLQFHWKPNSVTPGQLDEYWNNVVLGIIGNNIEAEGEFSGNPIIQGIRFVNKMSSTGKQAGVRVEVWFSRPSDARHLQKVKTKLEKYMAVHLDGSLGTVPRCDIKYHSPQHQAASRAQ